MVCHTGVIQFPIRKGWKRVHRLVVLPDYQGIGIGTKFIKAIAELYKNQGYEFNLTTTTPSLVHALVKDKDWTLARYGRSSVGFSKGLKEKHLTETSSGHRITYSFNYKDTQK